MKKSLIATGLMLAFSTQAHVFEAQNVSSDNEVWITIGNDAEAELVTAGGKMPLYQANAISAADPNKPLVAKIKESQLAELSTLMHDNHHRCGGFIVHNTLTSAINALNATDLDMFQAFTAPPIEQQTLVNATLPKLAEANIESTINHLSNNYVNRYYTTTGGRTSSDWIQSHWQSLSSGKSYVSVDKYNHSGYNQDSVIMTITGSSRPDEIVVVGGHLDSTVGSTGENTRAPGADDDASGIATMTEVIRVMMADNIRPERTIKFMGYAAEEVGLRGSGDIASAANNANDNIIGVLQLDMTAYKGSQNDIVMMSDYTNAAQNAYLGQLMDEYIPTINWGYDNCGYGCSDHASWHNNGFPASMPFEAEFGQHNQKIHTADDTLATAGGDASHAIKFAKLAAAYVIELGNAAASGGGGGTGNVLENGVALTNQSGGAGVNTYYTMDVAAGASNLTFAMSGGTGDADMYVRFGQQPTTSTYDCRPYKSGNNETCNVTAQTGTWHVMLRGYSAYSGVTLTGSYDTSGGGGGNPPASGSEANLSASTGNWVRRTTDVPSGMSSLTVSISGGSGDADLYLRRGSEPTTSAYDCRPYKSGNSESCTVTGPAADTYHTGIRAYNAFSGLTWDWAYN